MPKQTSSQAREAGNIHFRSCRLNDAISCYKTAISLDPVDPAPRRTLSSALFELGRYVECRAAIDEALALEKDDGKRKTLRWRRARCLFYEGRLDEAGEGEGLSENEMEKMRAWVAERKGRAPSADELVDTPLTRPRTIDTGFGNFPHGHDTAVAAFTADGLVATKRKIGGKGLDVSLFYGGVGDARHVYQQLADLSEYSKAVEDRDSLSKDVFTIVLQDISPHIIARDLIVLHLFHDYNLAKGNKEEQTLILTMVWYVYAAEIVPGFVYDRLTALVQKILDSTTGNICNLAIPWIAIDSETLSEIRPVFEEWHAGYLEEEYDVDYMQHAPFDDSSKIRGSTSTNRNDPLLSQEYFQYRQTKMVYPPPSIMKQHSPGLAKLLANRSLSSSKLTKELKAYAQEHWMPNFTRFGDDTFSEQGQSCIPIPSDQHTIMEGLVAAKHGTQKALMDALKVSRNPILVETTIPFFRTVAEILVGPIEIRLELSAGCLYHESDRHQFQSGRKFDAILVSNVPDMMGGSLTTAIHLLPLLKPDTPLGQSYAQFNHQSNASRFTDGFAGVLSEYACLPSLSDSANFLSLQLSAIEPFDTTLEKSIVYFRNEDRPKWVETLYLSRWSLAAQPSLPNKTTFNTWLMRVFLRLVLPAQDPPGPYFASGGIPAPLTLLTFLRLCHYLITIRGIPAHWIGTLLDTMLTGEIQTIARPPSISPMLATTLKSTDKQPARTWCMAPYLAELVSQLSRFAGVLKLPLTTPLPPATEFDTHSLMFDISPILLSKKFELVLVFIRQGPAIFTPGVYDRLASGQKCDDVVMVTNFKVVEDEETGRHTVQWHMQTSVYEKMKYEKWVAMLMGCDKLNIPPMGSAIHVETGEYFDEDEGGEGEDEFDRLESETGEVFKRFLDMKHDENRRLRYS